MLESKLWETLKKQALKSNNALYLHNEKDSVSLAPIRPILKTVQKLIAAIKTAEKQCEDESTYLTELNLLEQAFINMSMTHRVLCTPALLPAMTNHIEQWEHCTNCKLAEFRRKTCSATLFKGKFPCKVLFIGEAPGETEEALGAPFTGRSGNLLADMLIDVEENVGKFSYACTNIVACVPRDYLEAEIRQPSHTEQLSCRGRLEEVIAMADPELIFTVGKISERALAKRCTNIKAEEITNRLRQLDRLVPLVHPAFILRQNEAEAEIWINRTISIMIEYIAEIKKLPF